MRLIDADKLETTAVLGVQLQHADSRYYYFYEEETIKKAPTVKAIPIEWLKSWAMRNWVKSKKCEFDIIVSKLIDDWWEEENAKVD